jgi:TldD protein
MLKEIKKQIDRIRARGASYVDARWHPYEESNNLMIWNGNLKNAEAAGESGMGVRVLYKGAWGFSASSDLNNLTALYDSAFDNARSASERVTFPVRLAEKAALQDKFVSPCRINPFDVPLAEKVDFLREVDGRLDQPDVFQR